MKINFDPTDEDEWVKILKTGNYTIGRTTFTRVGHVRIYLKRKKGADSVPRISRMFYIELLESKVEEFISRVKRKADL